MTDRDALYAAVLAAPDDDTPRLVYADYLDDTGERADGIRARFIRNQVALARAEPWSDEADRLFRATASVDFHYRDHWAADLDPRVARGFRLDRGFVGRVTCPADPFLADGARLFARHPIRSLELLWGGAARDGDFTFPLGGFPVVGRVHTLELVGLPAGETFLLWLRDTQQLDGVRRLRVWWDADDDADRPLAEPDALVPPGVTELDLDGNAVVGDQFLRSLVGHAAAAQLEALDLTGTNAGPDGFRAVAGSPHLAGLRRLSVGRAYRREPAANAVLLAESPHLRGLVELDLAGVLFRGTDPTRFAAAYAWPGLKRLGLRGSGVGRAEVRALAANPLVRSLAAVDLRDTEVRAADVAPLRAACPDARVLTDDTVPFIPVGLAPEDQP